MPITTTQHSNQDQDPLDRYQRMPVVENDPVDAYMDKQVGSDAFGNAIERGTDQLQATLYGFTKTLGDTLGVDALSKWSEEGIEFNIQQIMANPAEVRDWDDVNSLAEFGTYFIEAIGEQVPQLAIDVPLVAAAIATRGKGTGAALETRAAIGKALKRKLGERAFLNFKRFAAAAPTLSLVAQGVGETKLEQDAVGAESDFATWSAGITKGLLDKVGLDYIVGKAAKVGLSPDALTNKALRAAYVATGGAVTEGATEAVQTIIDKAALEAELGNEYDFMTEANFKEIREAAIKGGIVGGALSGSLQGLQLYSEYAVEKRAQSQLDVDSLFKVLADQGPAGLLEHDGVIYAEAPSNLGGGSGAEKREEDDSNRPSILPEDQDQIDAQARALLDPDSAKEVMEITNGSPLPSIDMPEETLAVPTEAGVALTLNNQIAEQIAALGGKEAVMGQVLYGAPNGKEDSDGTVVQGRDADGNVIYEEATNPYRLAASIQNATAQAPNGRVEVTTAERAIQERSDRLLKSRLPDLTETIQAVAPNQKPESILMEAEQLVDQLGPDTKLSLLNALRDPAQFDTAAKGLVGAVLKQRDTRRKQKGKLSRSVSDQDFQTESPTGRIADDAPVEGEYIQGLREDTDPFAPSQTISPAQSRRSQHTSDRERLHVDADGRPVQFRNYVDALNYLEKSEQENLTIKQQWDAKANHTRHRIVEKNKGDDSKPKTVDAYFEDVIEKASNDGEARHRFTFSKKTGQDTRNLAKDSFIEVFHPETGEVKRLTTLDLTTGGMNLLSADQVQGLHDREFRLAGFLHSLSRLGEMGYVLQDVPGVDGERIKSPLRTKQDGTVEVNPRLLIDHGNLKQNPGDVVRVQDALFTPTHTRRLRAKVKSLKDRLANESLTPRQKTNLQNTLTETQQQLASSVKVADTLDTLSRLDKRIDAGQVKLEETIADTAHYSKEATKHEGTFQGQLASEAAGRNAAQVKKTATQLNKDKTTRGRIQDRRHGMPLAQGIDFDPDNLQQTEGVEDSSTRPRQDEDIKEGVDPRGVHESDQLTRKEARNRKPNVEFITPRKVTPDNTIQVDKGGTAKLPKDQSPSDKPNARSTVKGLGDTLAQEEVEFIQAVAQDMGLGLNLTIVEATADNLNALAMKGELPLSEVQDILNEIKNGKKGIFVSRGPDGIIVVPPLRKNASDEARAQRLWVMGHELGHGALNAAMETMSHAHWQQAEAIYQKEKGQSAAYEGQYGFAEWFADKVINRAMRGTEKKDGNRGLLDRLLDKTAKTLRRLWRSLSGLGKKSNRFKQSKSFNEFLDGLRNDGVFMKATTFGFGGREYYTPEQAREAGKAGVEKAKAWVKRNAKKLHNGTWLKHPINLIITGDHEMRHAYGETGQKIADFFYWQFNTTRPGRTPFFSVMKDTTERYMGDFLNAMGAQQGQELRFSKDDLKDAFDQLSREAPDAELNEAATVLRKFLKDYHTKFLKKAIPTIGEIENYFPRQHINEEIEKRPDEWKGILARHGIEDADNVMRTLLENEVGLDSFSHSIAPSGRHSHARQLNDPALIKDLVDNGFLNDNPVEVLISYLQGTLQEGVYHSEFGGYRFLPGASLERTIKKWEGIDFAGTDVGQQMRNLKNALIEEFLQENGLNSIEQAVEWNYARYDRQGELQIYDRSMKINETLKEGLKNEDITPEQANRIRHIIQGYMGKHGLSMNPKWKHAQTNAMMITNWLTLMLSPVSSLIEAATLFKSVKDVGNFRMAVRGIVASVKDRKELMALYGQMGLVEHHLQANILSAMYGYQNATEFARSGNEVLFRVNGQHWLTQTMRLAAAHTGVEFIKHHTTKAQQGDTRSQRYLAELGITNYDHVTRWIENGQPVWDMAENNRDTRVVQSAISRFVEASVLTPSRAERPNIFNDPRAGLFWHLKSFAYTFSANVVGSMARESKTRYQEKGITDAMKYLIPVTGVFLGLAAIVNEFREELQYRLGSRYRPSDHMDGGEYMAHLLFNRIGFGAVGDMYWNALSNQYNNTLGIFALSPVLGKGDQLLRSPNALEALMDATPVLSQNPGGQRLIRRLYKDLNSEDED